MNVTDVLVEVRVHPKCRDDRWKPYAAAEWFLEAAAWGVDVDVLPDPVPDLWSDLAVVISNDRRYVLTACDASFGTDWIQAIPEEERIADVERAERTRAEFAALPDPPF